MDYICVSWKKQVHRFESWILTTAKYNLVVDIKNEIHCGFSHHPLTNPNLLLSLKELITSHALVKQSLQLTIKETYVHINKDMKIFFFPNLKKKKKINFGRRWIIQCHLICSSCSNTNDKKKLTSYTSSKGNYKKIYIYLKYWNGVLGLTFVEVPDDHYTIPATGQESLTIGCEGQTSDRSIVSLQHRDTSDKK